MIPGESRLPREEFKAAGYRKVATPFFLLKTKKNGLSINRIGVVVGLTVDKRAVIRNFWERQAKAKLVKLPAVGNDFILVFFPEIKKAKKSEFSEIFEQAVEKLKIRN